MIQNNLIKWGRNNYRSFSWRESDNPYHIMIAEFMLQRTKAKQVEPVYNKFISKYTNVFQLSNAKQKSISNSLNSLGLYWRANHFIEAATFIVNNYDGIYPDDRNVLSKIPGIGEYISGAISIICFNKKEHVIDSNIARFINRYYGLNLSGEIRRRKQIVNYAKELFNFSKNKKLLFAILDFTYQVCKPINPLCHQCILSENCKFNNA